MLEEEDGPMCFYKEIPADYRDNLEGTRYVDYLERIKRKTLEYMKS